MKFQRWIWGLVLIAAIPFPSAVKAQVAQSRLGPQFVVAPFGDDTVFIPTHQFQASSSQQLKPPSFGSLTSVAGGFLYHADPEFWVRGSDNFEWSNERVAAPGYQVFILAEHEGTLEHREPFSALSFPISPWEVVDGEYVNLEENSTFGSRVLEFTMGANARPHVEMHAKGGGGNSGTRITLDTDPEPYIPPSAIGITEFPMAAGYDFSGLKIWWITVRSLFVNQDLVLQMRGEAILENGSVAVTGWASYPQDITKLRFHWWPASSPNAGDGGILLAHGETPMAQATGLNILPNDLDEVHLGILEPVTELQGKIYVDNFNLVTNVEAPQLVPLFADGAEDGRLGAWQDTSSRLIGATTAAAHNGDHGIAFDLNTAASNVSLVDMSPANERHLRIRFDFDPSNVVHPQGNAFSIVTAWDQAKLLPVLRARVLTTASGFALQVLAWGDSGTAQSLPWILVTSDDWNDVEIQWWAASAFGMADGGLRLWIDGQLKGERLDLANSSDRVHEVDLGARGVDAGTSGTLFMDNYESRY